MTETAATDKTLGKLHKAVAESFLNSLENSERSYRLIEKYKDKLREIEADDLLEFLKRAAEPSPSMLSAATKFLKDNEITAVSEPGNTVSALQKRLAEKNSGGKISSLPVD